MAGAVQDNQQPAGNGAAEKTPADDTDGGLINSFVEALGLNGVTKTALDHNRFLTLSLVLGAILLIWSRGFETKATSPFDGSQVTSAQLNVQFDVYQKQKLLEIKGLQDDLNVKGQETQDALAKIHAENAELASAIQAVAVIATASAPATGQIGPLIGVIATLVTAGLAGDNARKSSVAAKTAASQTDTDL